MPFHWWNAWPVGCFCSYFYPDCIGNAAAILNMYNLIPERQQQRENNTVKSKFTSNNKEMSGRILRGF